MNIRGKWVWNALPSNRESAMDVDRLSIKSGAGKTVVRKYLEKWVLDGLVTCASDGGRGRYFKTEDGNKYIW
jgi:hypothetical protein